MKLHQRGVDLLLDVQHALEHHHTLTPAEIQHLLRETEEVLRYLLARDVPVDGAS